MRQRHALLLNLKDDAITVFLTTGAASLRDIAAALELPAEEFAALWNDLPLPDNTRRRAAGVHAAAGHQSSDGRPQTPGESSGAAS